MGPIRKNGRHRLTIDHKIILAKLIGEKREILFGKRSSQVKNDAWQTIIDDCRSKHGFSPVADDRDNPIDHLKNNVWTGMKHNAIRKYDSNRASSLARGGEKTVLTELDTAVLDAIGYDSATPVGRPSARRQSETNTTAARKNAYVWNWLNNQTTDEGSSAPETVEEEGMPVEADDIPVDTVTIRSPWSSSESSIECQHDAGSRRERLVQKKESLKSYSEVLRLQAENLKLQNENLKLELQYMRMKEDRD